MGLRIRTNTMSLIAQRQLGLSGEGVKNHMEKLASGYRINRAADDAAGLAISEVIRSDVRSLNQSRRNTMDGISLVQVAEGSLNEITNILIRLKELAVQGASDTIGDRERHYLNLEFFQLKDEIDRIAVGTEFNGTRLLVGMSDDLPQAIMGSNPPPPFEIQVDKEFYEDADSLSVRNPLDIIRLDFRELNARTKGPNSLNIGSVDDESGTRVDSQKAAQISMATVDEAIKRVAGHRANLGALQNRLEATDRNLGIRIENLAQARSRIVDADFAAETASYTQFSILQQAGASVLSQANQLPNIAVQLLK